MIRAPRIWQFNVVVNKISTMENVITLDLNPPNPISKRRFQFAFDGVGLVLGDPPLPLGLRLIISTGKRGTAVHMAVRIIPRRRKPLIYLAPAVHFIPVVVTATYIRRFELRSSLSVSSGSHRRKSRRERRKTKFTLFYFARLICGGG